MPRTIKPILFGTAIVAALLGALLARLYFAPPAPPSLASGTILTPPRPLPSFKLVDSTNRPFDNQRLHGHWSVVFFGFTNCGYVCPTTMTTLADMAKRLKDVSHPPQVVFISVDAQRDTPEVVGKYVHGFDPAFVGVTGTQTAVDTLTQQLGIPSAIRPLDTGGYAVDHSAAILVMDPQGRWHAMFSPPHRAQTLADDMRALMSTAQ